MRVFKILVIIIGHNIEKKQNSDKNNIEIYIITKSKMARQKIIMISIKIFTKIVVLHFTILGSSYNSDIF